MAAATIDRGSSGPGHVARIADKVWREVSRPIRRAVSRRSLFRTTRPRELDLSLATVEAEGTRLLQRLVRESSIYTGPIVEIGTLLGITTTNLALAKAPEQKIITVDLYCWNPWGLTEEAHAALASQLLRYLVETGQVEQVRVDKNEFYRTYSGPPPAIVFLDAMHDYQETKKDIEWARSVGAKIISGHDYCEKFPGVIQVVDEFGGPRELAGSVWVL
jgi:predicted O-methyltransferase YrrM